MKRFNILIVSALLAALAQTANADHHEAPQDNGMRCHNADKNSDGTVSHDEFMTKHEAMAEKMFTQLDTNKDGKIDEAEHKAKHDRCERHHQH